MKNILYIHQYFKTPSEGGALRSYFIAKGLIEQGYTVQMITSHSTPGYQQKLIEGVVVHYLPVQYSNDMSFRKRFYAFLKFTYMSIRYTKNLQKPDLIYATSTPLSIGLIALWWKWREHTPYIFEVRDLWPDAPIELGIIKNFFLKYLSKKLEKTIYRNAQKIVVLSPGIQSAINNQSQSYNISLVPNMSDIQFFQRENQTQKTIDTFTIGYFGAFGYANNLDFIIGIAASCQREKLHVKFLLAGEGAKKDYLIETIEKINLKNIEVVPPKNRFEIRDLMTEVDACLTSFLSYTIFETNSPNKFFDGLAAGKLSIVNTGGWLKELVELHQCGIYADPEKPEDFPELIKPFLENRVLLDKYQKNALELGEQKFSRNKLVGKLCSDIKNVLT